MQLCLCVTGNDVTPGPGDYDTHNIRDGVISDEHRTPAISIGQRTKLPNKTEVPPPNTYDIQCGFLVRLDITIYAVPNKASSITIIAKAQQLLTVQTSPALSKMSHKASIDQY